MSKSFSKISLSRRIITRTRYDFLRNKMPDIPEPVKVSPIIKFFRYTFLIAGILYGASKLKALKILEEGKKEERERKRKEKEERLAQEKQAASDRDIASIVAIFTKKPDNGIHVSKQSYMPHGDITTYMDSHKLTESSARDSDDSSVCTAEEIKGEVELSVEPSLTPQVGSGQEQLSIDPRSSLENKKSGLFSSAFNLQNFEEEDASGGIEQDRKQKFSQVKSKGPKKCSSGNIKREKEDNVSAGAEEDPNRKFSQVKSASNEKSSNVNTKQEKEDNVAAGMEQDPKRKFSQPKNTSPQKRCSGNINQEKQDNVLPGMEQDPKQTSSQVKSAISDTNSSDNTTRQLNGYFVETFTDNISYIELKSDD